MLNYEYITILLETCSPVQRENSIIQALSLHKIIANVLLLGAIKKFIPAVQLQAFILWLEPQIKFFTIADCEQVLRLLQENRENLESLSHSENTIVADFQRAILNQKANTTIDTSFFSTIQKLKYPNFFDLLRNWISHLNCVYLAKKSENAEKLFYEKNLLNSFEKMARCHIFYFIWADYEKYFSLHQQDPQSHGYAWKILSQVLSASVKAATADPVSLTYQKTLHAARSRFIPALPKITNRCNERENTAFEHDKVTKAFTDYHEDIKKLLSAMLSQAITYLGDSNISFIWIGFGSYARKELSSHSDLEFGLLIEENLSPVKQAYIDAYLTGVLFWFQFDIAGLGETNDELSGLPNGFRIDNKLSVKLCDASIDFFYGSPKQVFHNNFEKAFASDPESHSEILHCLLSAEPIYAHQTSVYLLKDFYNLVTHWLSGKKEPEKTNGQWLHQQCFYCAKGHFDTLSTRNRFDVSQLRTQGLPIKTLYLAPLSHLLMDLFYAQSAPDLFSARSVLTMLRVLPLGFDTITQNAFSSLYIISLLLRTNAQNYHQQQLDPEYIALSIPAQMSLLEHTTESSVASSILFQLKRIHPKPQFQHIYIEDNPSLIDYFRLIELFFIPTLKNLLLQSAPPKKIERNFLLDLIEFHLKSERHIKPLSPKNQSFLDDALSYFYQHHADTIDYINCYSHLLPQEAIYFFIALKKLYRKHPHEKSLLEAILKIDEISKTPSLDGFCVWREVQRREWYTLLQCYTAEKLDTPEAIETALSANEILMHCSQLDNPDLDETAYYYFSTDVVHALFMQDPDTQQWHFKDAPSSLKDLCHHKVLPIPNPEKPVFWAKILPENAAGERLDEEWMGLLTGDGGIGSLEAKLIIPIQKTVDKTFNPEQRPYITIPVLFTSHVPGSTLSQKDMFQHPYKMSLISSYSWTWSFLRVLFVTPEDDRGEDYKLVPLSDEYALVRFDRERSFYSMVHEKTIFSAKYGRKPIVKSILLCMNQIKTQPLNSKLLNRIAGLDPEQVIEKFLTFADNLANRFKRLYQQLEAEIYMAPPNALFSYVLQPFNSIQNDLTFSTISLIGVGFRQKLYRELLTRLSTLKFFIQHKKIESVIFGETLLKILAAPLADFYQVLFEKIPIDSRHPEKAELRYTHLSVVREEYEQSAEGNRKTKHSAMITYSSVFAPIDGQRNFLPSDMLHIFQNDLGYPSIAEARHQLTEEKNKVKAIFSADSLMKIWDENRWSDKKFITQLKQLSSSQRLALLASLNEKRDHILTLAPLLSGGQTVRKNIQAERETQAEKIRLIMQAVLSSTPLIRLNFSHYPLLSTTISLQAILTGTAETLLHLKICHFDEITPVGLNRAIARCVQLYSLTLENLPWETLSLTPSLPIFSFLPCLTRLTIRNAPSLRIIKTSFTGVKEIELTKCPKVTHRGLEQLIPNPTILSKLILSKTNLAYPDFITIFPFLCTQDLTDLLEEELKKLHKHLASQCDYFSYESEQDIILPHKENILKAIQKTLFDLKQLLSPGNRSIINLRGEIMRDLRITSVLDETTKTLTEENKKAIVLSENCKIYLLRKDFGGYLEYWEKDLKEDSILLSALGARSHDHLRSSWEIIIFSEAEKKSFTGGMIEEGSPLALLLNMLAHSEKSIDRINIEDYLMKLKLLETPKQIELPNLASQKQIKRLLHGSTFFGKKMYFKPNGKNNASGELSAQLDYLKKDAEKNEDISNTESQSPINSFFSPKLF